MKLGPEIKERKDEFATYFIQAPTDPNSFLAERAKEGWALWHIEPFAYTIRITVVRPVQEDAA